ncbi:unnamed protein product [Prorocentrum cordatum]|uniref:Uncharacterized protein n=1 Tax=Prorocentrum cordatum TaxID=2364126 RepID=A0ABN9RDR1_9DINO|nr:unnamed protein product [Polarella glacialis]
MVCHRSSSRPRFGRPRVGSPGRLEGGRGGRTRKNRQWGGGQARHAHEGRLRRGGGAHGGGAGRLGEMVKRPAAWQERSGREEGGGKAGKGEAGGAGLREKEEEE